VRLTGAVGLLAWVALRDPAFRNQIIAVAAVLLVSVGLGTVTSVQLGSGVLTAVATINQRLDKLESFCEKRKTVLAEDALALVDDDPEAAKELVELTVDRVVSDWSTEVDAGKLYGFLICVLVELAEQQQRQRIFTRPPDAPPRPPAWRSLSLYERGVVRLIGTHRIKPEVVAEMLDRSPEVVKADYDRCVKLLNKPQAGNHGAG
jgi:hypothetical protein